MRTPSTRSPQAARLEKILKTKVTRGIYVSRCCADRRYAGLGPSSVRTRIPSTPRLGNGCHFAKFYAASVCDNNFPSLVAFLFSWRRLAASSSFFLHATMNIRPTSVTASTHTSAFNAIAFQSPVMPNARMSLCTSSHPHPLRTAPSKVSDYDSTLAVARRSFG